MRNAACFLAAGFAAVAVVLLVLVPSVPEVAQAYSPGMSLNMQGADGNDVVVNEPFALVIRTNDSPFVAISGFQTEVDPDGLVYDQKGCNAESGVGAQPVCAAYIAPSGEIRHAVQSGVMPPFPALDVPAGASGEILLYLQMHCETPGAYMVTLTAAPGSPFGALYWDTLGEPIYLKGGEVLTVNCFAAPTPTPTRTPTSTPTPTPSPTFLPVGGIAEVPVPAGPSLEASGSSGPGRGVLAGIAAALAACTVALGGVAWHARRRWLS